MILRVGGVTVVGTANAVLKIPEGRRIPPEDQAAATVGRAGPVLRIARYRAVKAGRVRLRDLTDLADTLLSAMGNDLKSRIAFHHFFQLMLLCKQVAKNFHTICEKEMALKRVLTILLNAISFAQI